VGKIGSFAKLALLVGRCSFANVPMSGWLKLFFKMCGGKNFKNIRVGLRVGLVYRLSLLKNAFKSVHLNCQVGNSSFFSIHFQGCTVSSRLGITVWRLAQWRISEHETVNTPQKLVRGRMFN
jgi:hypothetical protein